MPASDHGVLVAVRMGHAAAERDPPSRRLRLHRLGVQALVWMRPAQSTLRLAAPRAPPRLLRRPLLDLQTLTKHFVAGRAFILTTDRQADSAQRVRCSALAQSRLLPSACPCAQISCTADARALLLLLSPQRAVAARSGGRYWIGGCGAGRASLA